MTQREFQSDEHAGAEPAERSFKTGGTSGPEHPTDPVSSHPKDALPQADHDNEINKELRRLNRALRALSACNQALAQAGSEQELLDEISDVIVRMGAYRFVWIGYAEPDEAKTVRPVARAGHEDE